jgi:hypothetical protein
MYVSVPIVPECFYTTYWEEAFLVGGGSTFGIWWVVVTSADHIGVDTHVQTPLLPEFFCTYPEIAFASDMDEGRTSLSIVRDNLSSATSRS